VGKNRGHKTLVARVTTSIVQKQNSYIMKSKHLLLVVSIFTLFSCKEKTDPIAFYYSAEWEPHKAIYIGWGYEAE